MRMLSSNRRKSSLRLPSQAQIPDFPFADAKAGPFEPVEYSVHTPRQKANMGKSKMDEAAAERIRRARGDKVCCSSLVTCQNV
jgi:hypothetical protein